MKGMLLAAGLGTRLRPLTHERPKPAMPFRLRTLGGEGLRAMARAGIREAVVNAHPLPEILERVLREDAPEEMRLAFSIEDEVLGTGGGIHKAFGGSAEPLLVFNGDVLYEADLSQAVAFHEAHRPFATLLVRRVDGSAPGTIDVDVEGRVRAILSADPPARGLTRFAFTGVHLLSPEALGALPRVGCVIREGYVRWLAEGARVLAHVDDAPFADLGTPAAYFAAQFGRGHEGEPRVSPEAQVAPGAVIEESYVGARAVVPGGAVLRRCIVWPDVVVPEGRLQDAILTPRTILPI